MTIRPSADHDLIDDRRPMIATKKTLPFLGASCVDRPTDDHHPSFSKRSFSQSSLDSKLLTIWLVPSHSLRDWQSANASARDPMNMWNPAGTLKRWYFSFTSRTYSNPHSIANKSSNYFILSIPRNYFLQSIPHWLSSWCRSTHSIRFIP